MGAFRRTEVQIHVFFFTVYRAFMCDGTNFLHFFSSNDSFHPENEGFFYDNWLDIWPWYVGSEHECRRFFL